MAELNIYQRINKVMQAVEYVQKDATVETGGGRSYRAVSHDMVLAVLRREMVARGIVTRLEQLTSSMLQMRGPDPKEKDQYSQYFYTADYAVHFVNIDNPADFLTVTINAHANDSGDKAPGKAASYAVKYAMLKTFGLETGENEESRFSEPYTADQAEVYHELIDQNKPYDFYLFTATLPHETQAGLHNSFPEGKKAQGKKTASKLAEEGRAMFLEVVEDVKARVAAQDISVIEITGEMSPVEKKLLASHLNDFEIGQLKRIKEAAA